MKDNSKFGSSQSLIDSVNEVLKGGQKKLDKNYNGKLDGEDFKKLRGVKEDEDDDDGWYTHKEIHGKGAVSRADWKKGIRTPKDADAAYDAANAAAAKARASRVARVRAWHDRLFAAARVRQDAEKLRQRNSKPVKESALGDLLGSEKGVKKIAPRKDEYGNEIKNPARSLARKAMKSFAAKAKELPMRKEEADQIEERNKENATKRKMMDASRGAQFKLNNPVPDAEPEHKTAQAHNKAIGNIRVVWMARRS